MRNIQRKTKFWTWLTAGLLLGTGLVSGQVEKGRTWTSSEGKKIFGVLQSLEDGGIVLDVGGKVVQVKRGQLGEEDQAYLEGYATRQPFGAIKVMELEGETEREAWLGEHGMRSFVWKGDGLEVPFLLHVPDLKEGEKAPLLVYLHGTGGIGTDNLKPLFKDGDGVAKSFMEEKFQSYRSCFVMIPQSHKMGGWWNSSLTLPGSVMRGVVDAIRLMDADPKIGIDPAQIYVTGLSMGGLGVYDGLSKFPGFFAAGIAISAVYPEAAFSREKDNLAPLWVAVNKGDRDNEERLRTFRRHYINEGGDIRISVFDQKGHNAWDALLKDQSFRQWLFRQKVE